MTMAVLVNMPIKLLNCWNYKNRQLDDVQARMVYVSAISIISYIILPDQ